MSKCYILIICFITFSILISIPVNASVDSCLFSTDSAVVADNVAPSPESPPPTPEANNEADAQTDESTESQDTEQTESEENSNVGGNIETNNNEEITSESSSINIQPSHPMNKAPFADFTWTTIDTIILFESTSFDPDGEIVEYIWWYDDYELNASFFMSNEPVFNYTFPEPGHYDVTLKVIDNNGSNGIKTKTVIAYICYPPVADFTWSQIGNTILFDGTSSYDPDGQIVKYFWMYFTSYGKPIPLGHTSKINYSFSEPGSYNVSLTVTDNDGGSDTIIKTIDYILSSSLSMNQQDPGELDFTEMDSEEKLLYSQLQSSIQENNTDDLEFIPFSIKSTEVTEVGIFENVFLKINLMFLNLPI